MLFQLTFRFNVPPENNLLYVSFKRCDVVTVVKCLESRQAKSNSTVKGITNFFFQERMLNIANIFLCLALLQNSEVNLKNLHSQCFLWRKSHFDFYIRNSVPEPKKIV